MLSIFHLQYPLLNVVSGVTKTYDGFFGNRDQVVGASFNPLRDATGALTGKPEIYDTIEILTEVGAGSIAPYLPFISAYNHSNTYNRSNIKSERDLNINNFATSSSNKNKKYTPKESETEVHNRVTNMYKGDSEVKVVQQDSYIDNRSTTYGVKGSVRPDTSVLKNGNVVETYEVKNYDLNNYSSMTSLIGKQAIQRENNIPKTAVQKVVIDVRGQNITPEMREQVIEDITRKSNNIIERNNIIFME